jgi:hypothetical protein
MTRTLSYLNIKDKNRKIKGEIIDLEKTIILPKKIQILDSQ